MGQHAAADAGGDSPDADGPAETATDGPTFSCGLCSRSFGSQNTLNVHWEKIHAAGGDVA